MSRSIGNRSAIEEKDIEKARDKILMGLERDNLALTDEERRLLAHHEGCDSVVAAILPNTDPIFKVMIVPRGRAMGVTQQLPEREKTIYQREYMLDRLAVMMGGRAAENEVFGTSRVAYDQGCFSRSCFRDSIAFPNASHFPCFIASSAPSNVFLA